MYSICFCVGQSNLLSLLDCLLSSCVTERKMLTVLLSHSRVQEKQMRMAALCSVGRWISPAASPHNADGVIRIPIFTTYPARARQPVIQSH